MGNIYLLRAFINCSYRLVSANHYHNIEEMSDLIPAKGHHYALVSEIPQS